MPQNTGPTAGFVTSCSDKQGELLCFFQHHCWQAKQLTLPGVEGAALLEYKADPPHQTHPQSCRHWQNFNESTQTVQPRGSGNADCTQCFSSHCPSASLILKTKLIKMHNSLPRYCTLFSRLKTEKKSFIKKVIALFVYIRDSLHNHVHLENMCIINHFHAMQQFLISKVV